jgi:hypothetical protein
MFRFISEEVKSDGTVQGLIDNVDKLSAGSLADQLNQKVNEMPACKIHPHQETIVMLKWSGTKPIYEIRSVCCQEFQKEAEHFLDIQ